MPDTEPKASPKSFKEYEVGYGHVDVKYLPKMQDETKHKYLFVAIERASRDKLCTQHAIDHRLIKPKHPQTNGMVERFNGRIADVLKRTQFDSSIELLYTLERYLHVYNHHIPQKALAHQTPFDTLYQYYLEKPERFRKDLLNHQGPDN